MAVDITRSLISVGVGVVDEVLEGQDANAGRTKSFRTWQDIGRLVIAGLGYGLQVFVPNQSRLGETLALSATPLLVKSIAGPVMRAVTGGPTTKSSVEQFVARKKVGRSYQPEFDGVRAW